MVCFPFCSHRVIYFCEPFASEEGLTIFFADFVCSSYPHGGWAILGLTLASIFALAATTYGVASCRFFYIDYMTDRGEFGDFYKDPTADGEAVLQRVGAGLYTWLVPSYVDRNGDEKLDWTDGQCAGYSESQRLFFTDIHFEVGRIFAVVAVLSGMSALLGILFLSCISMKRCQIWMLSLVLAMITCSVGVTFIVFWSKLCNDLVSYQDESYTTECTIDQGGLVLIGAVIFWAVAFLISIVYIKDPERDMGIQDGVIMNAFDKREEDRIRREKERKIRAHQKKGQRKQKKEERKQKKGKPKKKADIESAMEASF